jgi:outer membrane lipoprotein carrier protein
LRESWLVLALIGALACGGADEADYAPPEQEGALPAAETGARTDTLSADTPAVAPSDTARRTDDDSASAAPAESSTVEAAQDPGAAVLERASQAYEGLRALRADFTMELENPLLRRTITSRGTIFQRSPDRILLRFTEPEGDIILGDGTYFWVYYPSVNREQVTRAPASQGESGGVDLRAQFVGEPRERFDYTMDGTENVAGRPAHVLTLVPKEDAGYRSLKVWIDDRDGLARRFAIVEHNGATRTFTFATLEKNPTLGDDLFQFTPPPGVRIVEPPR